MRPLLSVFPRLSTALERLSDEGLRNLVTQRILDTAHHFAQLPEVEECRSALRAGDSLIAMDAKRLHDLHQSLEQRELDIQASGGPEDERDMYFRMGRYVFALSLAAQQTDVEQVDNLLYDMAHAFDDQDAFWKEALREAEALADKRP